MPKHSEEVIRDAVAGNSTIAGVLRSLGIDDKSGSSYRYLHQKIRLYHLDTSHFSGQAHLKGKRHTWAKKKPLKDILIENSSYTSSSGLKRRLIQENLLEEKCALCGISHWRGEKLSLELDHINGISNDNRITNLRLLCPNCHSQTDTYCGRNIKQNRTSKVTCVDCYQAISRNSKRCMSCAIKARSNPPRRKTRIIWPSTQDLQAMISSSSYSEVGRRLGVSDNAIRKRLRNHPVASPNESAQERERRP